MVTPLVEVAPPARGRPPFDPVTITLHWTTLLIVLTLFGSGLLYGQVEERSWALPLLHVHRSLGVMIWALTALRLLWRVTGARFPEFPASMTPLHQLVARLSEYGLYALLLLQPATGLAQTILRGRPFAVFAWTLPPLVPRDLPLVGIFQTAHEIGAGCLFALVGLHAVAALAHHFILHDDVLETMAPALRRKGILDPRAGQGGRRRNRPLETIWNRGGMATGLRSGSTSSTPRPVARPRHGSVDFLIDPNVPPAAESCRPVKAPFGNK